MFIRQFNSWVILNKNFLSEEKAISNTCLIIDANQLIIWLFRSVVSPRLENNKQVRCDVYGSDIVMFGQEIEIFFENLQACKIKPTLVYSGINLSKSDNKTLIEKFKKNSNKFETLASVSENPSNYKFITLMPNIAFQVFQSVTSRLKLDKIQCLYDGIGYINHMANTSNCLVLTNYASLLLFEGFPKGFLLLDLFDFKNCRNNFIKSPVFNQTLLLRQFSDLKKSTLLLLSALTNETSDELKKRINSQYWHCRLKGRRIEHMDIILFLNWIQGKSLDEVLNFLEPINSNIKNEYKTIAAQLKCYRTFTCNSKSNLQYPTLEADLEPTMKYLLRKLEIDGRLTSLILNLMNSNFYACHDIDNPQLPSASQVKYRPISVALSLLKYKAKQARNESKEKDSVDEGDKKFVIFDRISNTKYGQIYIEPCKELDTFGSLDEVTLSEVIHMDDADKKAILMDTFRFDEEQYNKILRNMSAIFSSKKFQKDTTVLLLLIDYIRKECMKKIETVHYERLEKAVLMTIFYYAAKRNALNDEFVDQLESFQLTVEFLKRHSVKNNYQNYPNSKNFRITTHFIFQLENAIEMYNFINGLLDSSLNSVQNLELYFNCTLIFRVMTFLTSNVSPADIDLIHKLLIKFQSVLFV